jgi:transposase
MACSEMLESLVGCDRPQLNDSMKLPANAPHGPKGRAELVRRVLQGHSAREVAEDCGATERTLRKCLARYRAEGKQGLTDRSSRPPRMPTALPAAVRAHIETLRRQRWTGALIAAKVGRSPATVHRLLQRLGFERLRRWVPGPRAAVRMGHAGRDVARRYQEAGPDHPARPPADGRPPGHGPERGSHRTFPEQTGCCTFLLRNKTVVCLSSKTAVLCHLIYGEHL